MQHENSVFHALTKHIPWAVFERLVAEHKADHCVRRLDRVGDLLALGQASRDRYPVFAIGTGINAHDLTAGANCACKLQSQQSRMASNLHNLVP